MPLPIDLRFETPTTTGRATDRAPKGHRTRATAQARGRSGKTPNPAIVATVTVHGVSFRFDRSVLQKTTAVGALCNRFLYLR